MERAIERIQDEVAEIERHKYFLSEKAGHDVGWEAAEKDWEEKYQAEFRVTHATARPVREHEAHTVSTVSRGGLRMLFHRMFSRQEND